MDDPFRPSLGRHNLRLPGIDYAQAGAYFVTIVTQARICLFGDIGDGEMQLNAAGVMVARVCATMPRHIPGMGWGIFQIMPNHFHAIIELQNAAGADPHDAPVGADPHDTTVGATLRGCPGQTRRSAPTDGQNINAPTHGQRRLTLGDVVGRFKSLTTRLYIDGVHANHWPPFTTRLWQRNYYEHIIRNEQDYQTIYDYVRSNPQNWEKDREYPVK